MKLIATMTEVRIQTPSCAFFTVIKPEPSHNAKPHMLVNAQYMQRQKLKTVRIFQMTANFPDYFKTVQIFQMTADFPNDFKTVRIFLDDYQFSG